MSVNSSYYVRRAQHPLAWRRNHVRFVAGAMSVPETLEDVAIRHPSSGTALVTFRGEHDRLTRDGIKALLERLVAENEEVVVDFSRAFFVDASILRVLLDADDAARRRGSSLRLRLGTLPSIRRAFEASGVLERLENGKADSELALGKNTSIQHGGGAVNEEHDDEWERDRRAWNLPARLARLNGRDRSPDTAKHEGEESVRPTAESQPAPAAAGDRDED